MSAAPFQPRLAHSRRGAIPPMQATLILAAALFSILALKQLLTGTAAPAAQAGTDKTPRGDTAAATPQSVTGPTAPPGVVTPSMAEANKRLDAIRDEIDTAYAASYVAYGRPGDGDPAGRAKFDRFMKQLEEKYAAEPIEAPGAGYRGTIFRPRNSGDKAILALAGSDGRRLPEPGTYDGSLQVAAGLVRQYRAEHLMVVGHSLGGGMAGYAGAMLGVRAVGFNSAPLGTASLENVRRFGVDGAESNVTNVNAAGEFASSYSSGRQVGEAITVGARNGGWLSFVWTHPMDNLDTGRGVAYQPAPRSR